MTNRIRPRYLGAIVLLAGAALCLPQVAGALPGHSATATKSAAATPARVDPGGCDATISVSGSTATAVPNPKHCNNEGGYMLVSYSAKSKNFATSFPQTLFAHAKMDGTSVSVALPSPPSSCFWQVDFVLAGKVLPMITRKIQYGARLVADMHGANLCAAATTTTTSTTVPSNVLGTSIVANTTTTKAPAVLASTTTQTLPRTGAAHVGLEALLGLGLIALGGSILAGDKRRRRLA